MKILFLNYTYPFPINGGTERALYNISSFLHSRGENIHCGFFEGKSGNVHQILKSLNLTNPKTAHRSLKEFLFTNNIEIIINFKPTLSKKVISVIQKSNCRLFTALRFAPNDVEAKILTILNDKSRAKTLKLKIKRIIKPFYLYYIRWLTRRRLLILFNLSEKYILQSERFIDPLSHYLGKAVNIKKIVVIPNMLSKSFQIDKKEINNKLNIVLIVARMEEKSKRILSALNIWDRFLKKCDNHNWDLVLVGDGSDLDRYRKFVLRENITNISFKGRQDPFPYYRKAKFFLMTSAAEGFSNTLIESLQTGCIPIVFNTFDSLSDIITDGENGYIVRNNDINAFVEKLLLLTNNDERRQLMAQNAVKSCLKFGEEIIGPKWLEILYN